MTPMTFGFNTHLQTLQNLVVLLVALVHQQRFFKSCSACAPCHRIMVHVPMPGLTLGAMMEVMNEA